MKFLDNQVRWAIILTSSVLLVWLITFSLTKYLENKIREEMGSHKVKVSFIQLSLFTRTLKINDLAWSSKEDSLNAVLHSIKLNTLFVEGISFYQLLVNKNIQVNKIVLDQGKIQHNKNIKRITSEILFAKYRAIACSSILMNNIETEILEDTVIVFSAHLNFQFTGATAHMDSSNIIRYSAKNSDGFASNVSFNREEGLYGSTIKKISFNTQAQKIIIDSVLLIPNFSKFEFAHVLGEQIVRLNISIPQVIIEGLEFDKLVDSTINISKITVQSFDSYAFKDKRVPFVNHKNVPLPMESFLNLSWKVKIDSILISNSRMTVEEFPEKGIASGILTLNDVNIICAGLNNRIKENDPAFAVMNVTGLFMNSAKIKASFQFPLVDSLSYHASGSVSKMPFDQLNPVLTKMANLRVKSGYLNSLTFNFAYTEFISKGHLDIDYEDLRITSLNTNKQTTNDLRTLFVNAVVKNTRDQSGPSAKVAGVISIERDRKKSIFNIWRLSILDGLRSSILGKSRREKANKKP